MPRTTNNCWAPKNVATTFFNIVHLLPKDLRFEHEGAKLVSCPGCHLTSVRPCLCGCFWRKGLEETALHQPAHQTFGPVRQQTATARKCLHRLQRTLALCGRVAKGLKEAPWNNWLFFVQLHSIFAEEGVLFQFVNVLMQALINRSHALLQVMLALRCYGLVCVLVKPLVDCQTLDVMLIVTSQDDICAVMFNMSNVDMDFFFSNFLRQFLQNMVGITSDQKSTLYQAFRPEKVRLFMWSL